MVDPAPRVLDVVELRVDSGRWSAGTIGTVVEANAAQALIEISDERGHGLDFIAVPRDALARTQASHRHPAKPAQPKCPKRPSHHNF